MRFRALNELSVDAVVAHTDELIHRHIVLTGFPYAFDVIGGHAVIFRPDELAQRGARIARRADLSYELRVGSVIAGPDDFIDLETPESRRLHRPDEIRIDVVILHSDDFVKGDVGASQVANLFDETGADAVIVRADDILDWKALVACGLKRANVFRLDSVARQMRQLICGKSLVAEVAQFLDHSGSY